ncbi:PDZ domain-containing protein [bacterium]|nr:PDZ domain-containing protein [bacterium]
MNGCKSYRKYTLWILILSALFIIGGVLFAQEDDREQGYLGVLIQPLSEENKETLVVSNGVLVSSVVEDGPADDAGILEDDVILNFNGVEITSPDHLTERVRETEPGTEVNVTLVRGREEKQVLVEVGRYQSDEGFFRWGRNGEGVRRFFSGRQVYLGVTLQDMNADLADYFGLGEDEGVLILDVQEDSPAEKSGLKSGDVIVALDDESVTEPGDIQDILADFEEGDEITVEIVRQRRRQEIAVELEENPNSTIRVFRSFDDFDFPGRMDWEPVIPRFEDFNGRNLEFRLEEMKGNLEEMEKNLEERLKGLEDLNMQLNLRLENMPRWI